MVGDISYALFRCRCMEILLITLFIFSASAIMYLLRSRKQEREREWNVWTSPSGPSDKILPSSQPEKGRSWPPSAPSQPKTRVNTPPSGVSVLPPASFSNPHTISLSPELATTQVAVSPGFYMATTTVPGHRRIREDDTRDNVPITGMSKLQLDEYIERKHIPLGLSSSQDALRIAKLDPEEVVYLNDKQWFHPSACDHYPSKYTVGEELLKTIKGTWILKKPNIQGNTVQHCYTLLDTPDAFLFLEANGFAHVAEALAPHIPANEI